MNVPNAKRRLHNEAVRRRAIELTEVLALRADLAEAVDLLNAIDNEWRHSGIGAGESATKSLESIAAFLARVEKTV